MTRKTRTSSIAGGVAAALVVPTIFVGAPAFAADEAAPTESQAAAEAQTAAPADTAAAPDTAAPEAAAAEAAASEAAGPEAATEQIDGAVGETVTATSAAPAAESAVVESVTVAVPAVADTTAPVIASVTPGNGAFVAGTTTFAVDVVESNVSYSYIEFHQNGRWLTDATKEPGSQIHGNAPKLVLDTTRFADGVYGLKITSTDTSGNSVIATTSVVVDNTKPVLSSNLTDGQWVSKTQDVVLTVTEANPIAYHAQLYRADGTAVDSVKAYAYAPTTGTLTIPAVNWSNLPEGDYRMVFSAKDKAGNSSSLSVSLRHDETRPSLELTGQAALRPSTPADVSFTAADGYALSTIGANLYDADNKTMLKALGSKNLSGTSASGAFALPTGLADGTYTVRASVKDAAGNSKTVTFQVTVDSVRPTLELTGQAFVRPSTPGEVSFEATDGVALAMIGANLYDADNKTMLKALGSKALSGTSASGAFALPTGLADGTYTVRASVKDAAGNSKTVTFQVTVDSVRPTLEIDGPANGATLTVGDLGDVTLTATDANVLNRIAANLYDADNKVFVAAIGSAYIDGDSWTGGWALPAGLDAGEYTIRASVTDAAGNSKTVTTSIVVVVADTETTEPETTEPETTEPETTEPETTEPETTEPETTAPETTAPELTTPETPVAPEESLAPVDAVEAAQPAEAVAAGETADIATATADDIAAAPLGTSVEAAALTQDAAAATSDAGNPNWVIALIAAIGTSLAGLIVGVRRRFR